MNQLAGKKIAEAREKKGWTQEQMAEKLAKSLKQGYSHRQYQKLEAGIFPKYKTRVVEHIDRILGTNIYAEIYEHNVPHETTLSDVDPPTYIQMRRSQKNEPKPYTVPLVPVKAQAGYARKFDQTAFIDQLELYPILPGIDPRGATWRYFEVQGDSMENALFDSDLVLVSMVPPEDWNDIKFDQVYVIVTSEDLLIKIIRLRNSNSWILDSVNKRYKKFEVAISDVKELWKFKRRISNKLKI